MPRTDHIDADRGRDWASLITAYLRVLDFVAEGDFGVLDIYRLALAIHLDCHSEEVLQLIVPDVVWAQDKQPG